MTPLRTKMIHAMPWQRLAPKPHKASVTAVAGLSTFDDGSPDRLRPEPMRASLHPLLGERCLAWRSCHQAAAGWKRFSTKTRGWEVLPLPRPPRTGRSPLPHMLRLAARQRLFTPARTPRHRVLLMTPVCRRPARECSRAAAGHG